MLTMKLTTGDTLSVTSVDERYTRDFDAGNSYIEQLCIECTPSEFTLAEYAQKLVKEDALDTIEIVAENNVTSTFEGYTNLQQMNQRILVTGEKSFSLILSKPE